jgi:sugar phosphate isomerase/epimerase
MGDYEIKDIYQGGYSSLSPEYGNVFTGYRVATQSLGITTDPRVADVINEFSQKLAPGTKTVELSMIQPEIFESVPKQHLQEVKRLSKLTGVDVTVHGPLVEASGISKDGFSEISRQGAERQMLLALERAQEINPDGSSPVTFHSTAVLPAPEIEKTKKGEMIKSTLIINADNGRIDRVETKERFFPGEVREEKITNEILKKNEEAWQNALTHLAYNTERAGELIRHYGATTILSEAEKKAGKLVSPENRQAITSFNVGKAFLDDSYRELKELCDIAYKYVPENEQKIIKDFYNEITPNIKKINETKNVQENIQLREEIVEKGIEVLNQLTTPPQIIKPLDEFAEEKTVNTFANVAFNAYKKVRSGDWKASPIISIENPPAGNAFARGEDLKNIVEKSREKFVEKAVQEGISKKEAEKQAEKLIGVTWDVGHINMLRGKGYDEKDIIKETEKVAPFVKHVHLSDNFGFEHTELPMGMGNVPFKEIMEKLGKKGFEAKKIIEAGNWWQHFKTSPVAETMRAVGSPVYSMAMGPYWNQSVGLHQGYFSGYGSFLPQVNYETFGAGFSQLPAELGGDRGGGAGGRMSGRGME